MRLKDAIGCPLQTGGDTPGRPAVAHIEAETTSMTLRALRDLLCSTLPGSLDTTPKASDPLKVSEMSFAPVKDPPVTLDPEFPQILLTDCHVAGSSEPVPTGADGVCRPPAPKEESATPLAPNTELSRVQPGTAVQVSWKFLEDALGPTWWDGVVARRTANSVKVQIETRPGAFFPAFSPNAEVWVPMAYFVAGQTPQQFPVIGNFRRRPEPVDEPTAFSRGTVIGCHSQTNPSQMFDAVVLEDTVADGKKRQMKVRFLLDGSVDEGVSASVARYRMPYRVLLNEADVPLYWLVRDGHSDGFVTGPSLMCPELSPLPVATGPAAVEQAPPSTAPGGEMGGAFAAPALPFIPPPAAAPLWPSPAERERFERSPIRTPLVAVGSPAPLSQARPEEDVSIDGVFFLLTSRGVILSAFNTELTACEYRLLGSITKIYWLDGKVKRIEFTPLGGVMAVNASDVLHAGQDEKQVVDLAARVELECATCHEVKNADQFPIEGKLRKVRCRTCKTEGATPGQI
eukprot:Polyplicarium_translucidae@DN2460_c0_g1_i1.p1